MMLLLPLPWSSKCWALPFLTVLSPSEAANNKEGKRHKTTIDWAIQMLKQVRRWEPKRELYLVGDGGYSCVKLGLECIKGTRQNRVKMFGLVLMNEFSVNYILSI